MPTELIFYPAEASIPWWKKINPVWWFLNDREPSPPDWYRAQYPHLTFIRWYLRNPFQNFGRYVIGVADRDHWAYGPVPAAATTWWDATPGVSGMKWLLVKIGWLRLPMLSYEDARVIIYAGWHADGFCGLKFNIKTSFQLW